ncbi:MAG TPA: hypothetical protein PKJ95_05515 [Atribacterota bacterium]|nr:hypothetical protein [Atribacterota bacterium]
MTQLNSNSIKAILQEELEKDGDFLKEMVRSIMQEVMEECLCYSKTAPLY